MCVWCVCACVCVYYVSARRSARASFTESLLTHTPHAGTRKQARALNTHTHTHTYTQTDTKPSDSMHTGCKIPVGFSSVSGCCITVNQSSLVYFVSSNKTPSQTTRPVSVHPGQSICLVCCTLSIIHAGGSPSPKSRNISLRIHTTRVILKNISLQVWKYVEGFQERNVVTEKPHLGHMSRVRPLPRPLEQLLGYSDKYTGAKQLVTNCNYDVWHRELGARDRRINIYKTDNLKPGFCHQLT